MRKLTGPSTLSPGAQADASARRLALAQSIGRVVNCPKRRGAFDGQGGAGRKVICTKVVILAGGRGTRLSEETATRPKPMVEIGGRPILWHIMKVYSAAGLKDFIICLGYKGYMIKEYFANYLLHESDVRIDVAARRIDYLSNGRGVED
jgi:hypothetical protein